MIFLRKYTQTLYLFETVLAEVVVQNYILALDSLQREGIEKALKSAGH
ncbi:hypothetical protein A45J_2099 [hot springs metagenome]|uniref:Uncharacterized protein n=1 Tax=hot springs metagenome TaxID=433727 RepID=A0A5J4KXL8_9ZZZZ